MSDNSEIGTAPSPGGLYDPVVRDGDVIYVSGQTARDGALLAAGVVGDNVDLEIAKVCARQCARNVLAQMQNHLGDLSRVRILKITVFVASVPEFTEHSLIADAASEVLIEAMGGAGRHARSAVGVTSLPRQSPVEIDATARVESEDDSL